MEPEPENIRSLYWTEKIKNAGYNVKYRALSYLQQCKPTAILQNFEAAYMLGRAYEARPDNLQKVNKALYEDFTHIIWLTYRAKFPSLLEQNGDGHVSDTGWGCMVRVGQMCVAQALRRFSRATTSEQIKPVLQLFSDFDTRQMFSIQNIVKEAKQSYDLEPGKWYNPSQISYVLADLFKAHRSNQWRGLELLVMNNATLFYDQIIFKMTGRTTLCQCVKQKVVCYRCYEPVHAVSLNILARIGLEGPEKKYLRVINKMMESRLFSGMIGGKPEKALFFVGKISDDYIYLDPHVVHEGVSNRNFEESFETYFCKSFRVCKNSSIDPSVGISFYLESLKDLDELYDYMIRIKENDPEDFFLFSSIETPEYMRPQPPQSEVYNREPEHSGFTDVDQL